VSLRRAALLALIPWALLMAAFFAGNVWGDLAANYGWPDDLRRMATIALILYAAFTYALTASRPVRRKKP